MFEFLTFTWRSAEKYLRRGICTLYEPPKNEPYLLMSDRVWCTVPLLERLERICILGVSGLWTIAGFVLPILCKIFMIRLTIAWFQKTPSQLSDLPIIDFGAEIREDPLDHAMPLHAAREVCLTPFSIRSPRSAGLIFHGSINLRFSRRWKRLDTDGNKPVFWESSSCTCFFMEDSSVSRETFCEGLVQLVKTARSIRQRW